MVLDKKQIKSFLQKLKIKKGDTVFFHGNAMGIFQVVGSNPQEKTEFFWKSIIDFIGQNGTIIVPSFTYSINKKQIFDIKKSKSKIGQFSEDFRKTKIPERTSDPIFSVCIHGKEVKKIKKLPYNNSFGKNSIFNYLYSNNVKFICLGCGLESVTFIHYVEQVLNVPYRKFKTFNAKILNEKNKVINKKIKYFCRYDDKRHNYNYNYNILKKEMKKKQKLNVSNFGRIKSYSFKSKDFFTISQNILKKNNELLINKI